MKRILAVLLAVMLLAAVVPATSLAAGTASNACTNKVYRVCYSGGRLPLRAGAGNSYDIITTLCNGKALKFISSSGNWYKVKTFSGTTGWVNRKYVKCGAYANVNTRTSGLNYRKGPGTCYAIKGSFAKGTRNLLVSKVTGNWAHVEKCGKSGWSCLTYLKWAH